MLERERGNQLNFVCWVKDDNDNKWAHHLHILSSSFILHLHPHLPTSICPSRSYRQRTACKLVFPVYWTYLLFMLNNFSIVYQLLVSSKMITGYGPGIYSAGKKLLCKFTMKGKGLGGGINSLGLTMFI